jgi:hypothetical protein
LPAKHEDEANDGHKPRELNKLNNAKQAKGTATKRDNSTLTADNSAAQDAQFRPASVGERPQGVPFLLVPRDLLP